MYRDVKFDVEKVDQVERDLQEAQQQHGNIKRIFLVNGDAFVLTARRLKEIAEKIHQYLPKVEKISMYSSINNIKQKTDDDLVELARLGIGDLWVGVETGHGEALKYLNKGSSIEDACRFFLDITQRGSSYNLRDGLCFGY